MTKAVAEKMENRTRSADDLIVAEEARKLGQPTPEPVRKPPEQKEDNNIPEETTQEETPDYQAEPEEETVEQQETKSEQQSSEDTSTGDAPSSENVDEYGNPVGKQKTYTEEEVQAMIRKRLRDKHADPAGQQQAVQQAAQDFKADPESEESWEKQLGDFVEKKINDLSVKKQQQAWHEAEQQSQADFESKFTTGMQKYGDFENVVSGKPITTSMMMATRSMQDPAAFLYAACKQQPAEIERIAKIADPYAQVAEIGRLEERMKKARVITSAPRPATRISGDTTSEQPKQSIDELINSHAKSKIMGNRK